MDELLLKYHLGLKFDVVSSWSKRALCFWFFFKPPQHKNFVLLMEQEKEYITADRINNHGVE